MLDTEAGGRARLMSAAVNTPVRIVRVFPRRTNATPDDELAFVGEPPFQRPAADEVHVSCTFTWDRSEAERLAKLWEMYYPVVKIGGPAYDDPSGEFVPGRYLKTGYVITTRGCPNHCGFCLVPKREGELRCLPVRDGHNVCDNNLLAAPRGHIERVLDMLARQRKRAEFTGGLEARRLEEWFAEAISAIGFRRVYFAYDQPNERRPVLDAIRLMHWYGHAYWRIGVYVLMGYDGDTVAAAEERLQFIVNAGAVPYPMLYRGLRPQLRPAEWVDLVGRILSKGGGRFAPKSEGTPEKTLFDRSMEATRKLCEKW